MKSHAKRYLVFGLAFCLVLVMGGYGAYRGYRSLRQGRLIKQAKAYAATSEDRKAQLCLQRALRYNPRDVDACRLMAELAEKSESPGALIWRAKVVELVPNSVDDRLALAQVALVLRDLRAATNALEWIAQNGKKNAGYHNIAGAAALAAGLPADAKAHFAEAYRLEPTNAVPQLNLALTRLFSTNALETQGAREVLLGLSSNPTNSQVRTVALRELTLYSLRSKQLADASRFAQSLAQQTNAQPRDRLWRLDVLRESRNPGLTAAISDFQRESGTNIASVNVLAGWLIRNGMARDALKWLLSLPPEIHTVPPISLAVADCLLITGDWTGLQKKVADQNWGNLEFLRRAFLASSLRSQNMAAAAKGEWELAIKAAGGKIAALRMLHLFSTARQWPAEAEDLLWTIVNLYPNDKGALRDLSDALYAAGRTRSLLTLYKQALQREPGNLAIKNNLAATALLLGADDVKPHELAHEVWQKAPTNAAYASTYALSLYRQKKFDEALRVMRALSPRDLEVPAIAGYYGLILSSAGDRHRAQSYLQWSKKARLLPEESALFAQVRLEK